MSCNSCIGLGTRAEGDRGRNSLVGGSTPAACYACYVVLSFSSGLSATGSRSVILPFDDGDLRLMLQILENGKEAFVLTK